MLARTRTNGATRFWVVVGWDQFAMVREHATAVRAHIPHYQALCLILSAIS